MSAPSGSLTTKDVLTASFPLLSGLSTSSHALECKVHAILQGGEPRWITLGDPRKALPVFSSWQPWNLSSRVRWSAVLCASAAGLFPRLPGVESSRSVIDLTYWLQNLPKLSPASNIVIHVGSRSHTRKAILFFVENRQIRFVAKVPLTDGGAEAILNEAAVLLHLHDHEFLPRTLFEDSQHGVAVQSWLDGKPVARGFTAAHVDLLNHLVNPGCTVKVSDHKAEIAAQVSELELPFKVATLNRALDLLSFDEPLQSFVEHRDFAPWNLKWITKSRLGLLDWEWSIPRGLPWQDICRFFYTEEAHFHGSGRVWETMRTSGLLQGYLDRFSIPAKALLPLTLHYLIRALCLDWRSGNERLARYSFCQIERLLNHPL